MLQFSLGLVERSWAPGVAEEHGADAHYAMGGKPVLFPPAKRRGHPEINKEILSVVAGKPACWKHTEVNALFLII